MPRRGSGGRDRVAIAGGSRRTLTGRRLYSPTVSPPEWPSIRHRKDCESAESSLEAAKAQLGTAKDALGDTELRAGAAGVITARNSRSAKWCRRRQPVFTLAQDGDRDAVFEVDECIFFGDIDPHEVSLALVSDPNVTAIGHVREVSPAVDPKSSTVRVKVAIQNPLAAHDAWQRCGRHGQTEARRADRVAMDGFDELGSKPAVWVVDPATNDCIAEDSDDRQLRSRSSGHQSGP